MFDAFVASGDDAEFGERMAVIGDDLARARTDYLASRAAIDNLVGEQAGRRRMTAVADPALGFWLRHVAAAGGLWEPDGDATYVVLPPPLRDAYRLPEELRVTADPDVAREDGATLLAAGHPVLAEAAERVLASGDAGYLILARPGSLPPGRDVLLAAARDAFPVDHGRIDLSGEPAVVLHPVIRVGALVTYELSAEDRFQEEAQRWVDVPSRRELPADLVGRLCRAEVDEQARPGRPEGLLPAIAAAHRFMDAAASRAARRSPRR